MTDDEFEFAVKWLTETTLRTGGALLSGLPVDRVPELRRATVRSIKKQIGGIVRTFSPDEDMIIVHSELVNDAMTDEEKQRRLRLAVDAVDASIHGTPPPEVPWEGWRAWWPDVAPRV